MFKRMLDVEKRTLFIPRGEAVFLLSECCLWDIRQTSKYALLSGHKLQAAKRLSFSVGKPTFNWQSRRIGIKVGGAATL